MAKIPFQVSARTARLIGRENVANTEGAIIELVKNCYDADATHCILLFDNKYFFPPEKITQSEKKELSKDEEFAHLIEIFYTEGDSNQFFILKNIDDELEGKEESEIEIIKNQFQNLIKNFRSNCSISIIDNGEGMSKKVIEKNWMTIGTDNKLSNIYSKDGRIRTGAKGIGRFALDRLGSNAKMVTKKVDKSSTAIWEVDWSEFESTGKVLGEIYADLNIHKKKYLLEQETNNTWNKFSISNKLRNEFDFQKGTIIKISNLREGDDWANEVVNKLFTNLESLIPPSELAEFNLYVYTTNITDTFGKVDSPNYEEFDYKIIADVNKEQEVSLSLFRKEFDVKTIKDSGIFELDEFKKAPFRFSDFQKKVLNIKKDLSEYAPNHILDLEKIGAFKFTFYFLKRQIGHKDRSKYHYKHFNSRDRSKWLNNFGGVKIFRDNFRVRPYGETDGNSFDWLNLSKRVEKSTAGISSKKGKWQVRSNQVVGVVNISRVNNSFFDDKSSREGLQENEYFEVFKEILANIISEFEIDRQHIVRGLRDAYEIAEFKEEQKRKADELLKKKESENDSESKTKEEYKEESETFKEAYTAVKEELDDIKDEIKLLRVLATTGLIITSFTHEFQGLSNRILYRTEDLKEQLIELINPKTLKEIPDYNNPIIKLKDIQDDDKRLKHWLDFSISAVRKDKRKRKKIDIIQYVQKFEETWSGLLSSRKVQLKINQNIFNELYIKAFEIDLDSIFNNLIANSVDAFKRRDYKGALRIITISFTLKTGTVEVIYKDSGPGLSKDIKNPQKIFEPFFSTKRDKKGNKIGTGLGMWIVKNTLDEYSGEIDILKIRPSFELKITLPI